MSAMVKFIVQIDGGRERTIRVKSGVYHYAAAALPALLEIRPPFDVRIWAPSVMPEYGPYYYRVREGECGEVIVEHLVRAVGQSTAGRSDEPSGKGVQPRT